MHRKTVVSICDLQKLLYMFMVMSFLVCGANGKNTVMILGMRIGSNQKLFRLNLIIKIFDDSF